jgi:ribulokinase
MAYVIGIDGGTESVRAFVFDLKGRNLASFARTYATQFPAPGRAEQDPREWWTAMGEAVRGAVQQAGIRPGEVVGLAADTTSCSVVVLDAEWQPLRPALIWMDVRAAAEADRVRATGDAALIVNGNGSSPVSAEWMIPKALWVATHEPAIYAQATTICEYTDYITWRLTGRKAASLNQASVRWHYNKALGGVPTSLLSKLGLDALPDKWPREFVAPGEALGPLTREAAEHLGLASSVQVVQGGCDAFIAMVGLGVSSPGQMALITGSSHLQLGVTDKPVHGTGFWGSYQDAVYPGLNIVEGGQTSTGSVIAWLRRLTGSLDFATLNEQAAKLPPGANGLLVLDHFQGNRTPHTDPLSRGAITGLSLFHGPEHLFRAVMEGIAFGTCAVLDAMGRGGVRPTELTVCGGASNSPLWLQIHADTAGLPIKVPTCTDAPALGSAVLAATGTGQFANIQQAIDAMTSVARVIEPRPEMHAAYDEIYQRYRQLYPALIPLRAPGG